MNIHIHIGAAQLGFLLIWLCLSAIQFHKVKEQGVGLGFIFLVWVLFYGGMLFFLYMGGFFS